jgi:gliding motility-associated-like protein
MKRLIYLIFFLTQFCFGFNLSVTTTNEACSGNGSLIFNTTNTIIGGNIQYIIYKLPNISTPFATTPSTTLNGLVAGDYRVIARETFGTTTTEQQQDVTIVNSVVPLTYNIQTLNQACSNTSTIIVNTLTGTPASYEIFNGPLLFPPQSSNTFSNLPIGVYKIRVFDNCGIGIVTTFTTVQNTTGITIGQPQITQLPNCNLVSVTNTLTAATGTVIGYPLNITYTILPPGGASIILNSTLNSGDLTQQNLIQNMTNYINQTFSYSISITDACNSTYSSTNFFVNNGINLTNSITTLDCNKNFFTFNLSNFYPPYTINFNSFPTGFNPALFNDSYPGPYNQNSVSFGNITLPTPIGTYDATITDVCGNTKNISFTIINRPAIPNLTGSHNGCLSTTGKINISIPGYIISTGLVTVAPSDYPFPLPHNITSLINNGSIVLNPVPLGNYVIELTNTCNDILSPIPVVVPAYVDKGLSSSIRNGCDLSTSAVKIESLNSKLTSISITSAPTTFNFSLPLNVSYNIAPDGIFYMNNLPPGNYTFVGTDECNLTNTINEVLQGYTITSSNFSLVPNCGSFDIALDFVSNGTTNQTFWLQKLIDSTTNTWGNPNTNVVYTNGTIPNSNNSITLINNTTNFNFSSNGDFRIVRSFLSFQNGSDWNSTDVNNADKNCIEILEPLSYNESLEFIDVYRLPCSTSGALDVFVEASGTTPLKYTLIQKDGLPFFLDNGTSNTFSNLDPAIYLFQIEDSCGNIVNRFFDVSTLESFILINNPSDFLQCKTIITNNETFNLSQQNSTILGTQIVNNYTITYYTTLSDAQSGTNQITNLVSFNPFTNPQLIYAKIILNSLPNCYELRTFNLAVGKIPNLNLNQNYLNCTNNPTIINASFNNLSSTTYLWSNGATTPSISITDIGITNLTVTATNIYNELACSNSQSINVIISGPPVIESIETSDWTLNENSITVITSGNGTFEYSLDNVTYQNENYFNNLTTGLYTVYVRDKANCGITSQVIWLLYYDKFFTPNNDGYNDYWRIKDSENEPDFKVIIYDRYGKVITSFNSTSPGWDGTYNGNQIFSNDYWFVAYRNDGRIHKGHFTLKR